MEPWVFWVVAAAVVVAAGVALGVGLGMSPHDAPVHGGSFGSTMVSF